MIDPGCGLHLLPEGTRLVRRRCPVCTGLLASLRAAPGFRSARGHRKKPIPPPGGGWAKRRGAP